MSPGGKKGNLLNTMLPRILEEPFANLLNSHLMLTWAPLWQCFGAGGRASHAALPPTEPDTERL